METFHNILIVDDSTKDRDMIASLFKKSLHELSAGITITCVSSLAEAKNRLSKDQFSIITLDGEFPSFVDGLWGHTLIPFIKEHQLQNPKIIMISGQSVFVRKGLAKGAHFGFCKHEITDNIMLNQNFELVPMMSSLS